jgi:hypothetical protein
MGWYGLDSSESGWGTVVGSCEQGDGPPIIPSKTRLVSHADSYT